jgi:hypothetical protein
MVVARKTEDLQVFLAVVAAKQDRQSVMHLEHSLAA